MYKMSDNQKSIMVISGYIAGWLISIVQYFIIVGIMVLINYVIPGEANPWLVAMVVMLIWRNNAFVKLAIKNSVQKVEEKK